MSMLEIIRKKVDFKINGFEKLHFGENKSYFLRGDSENYLLKIYRDNRGFKQSPEGEIDFTQTLISLGVKTSDYLKFNNDQYVEKIDGKKISIQKVIQGYMILNTDEDYYFKLGQELRGLHSLTKDLKNDFDLPEYCLSKIVDERWQFVREAKFLSKSNLEEIEEYKRIVESELEPQLDKQHQKFIHFDAHTGNLIFKEEDTYFIDWEECGFGNPLLDLAVPCTHIMRDKERVKNLDALLGGHNETVDRRELNLMTIAKFLYLMTHIPTRLDVLKEPEEIFKRYLNYFEILNLEY